MKQERTYPRVEVTRKAENSIKSGHPWIYHTELVEGEAGCNDGALVDIISPRGRYLGTGFFNSHSKIRVRLLSTNANDRFDEAFWERRLRYAWEYRKTVMGDDLACCRVIFGEADSFPGLTVDRFNDILVTQTLSLGVEQRKSMLFPLLVRILREDGQDIRGVYERNDVAIREREGMEQNKGFFPLDGSPVPESTQTEIVENGIRYLVELRERAKDRLLPGSKIQPAGGRPPEQGKARAGLLYAHGLLWIKRGQGRRGAMSAAWIFRNPLWTWRGKTPAGTGSSTGWTLRRQMCLTFSPLCPAAPKVTTIL